MMKKNEVNDIALILFEVVNTSTGEPIQIILSRFYSKLLDETLDMKVLSEKGQEEVKNIIRDYRNTRTNLEGVGKKLHSLLFEDKLELENSFDEYYDALD